MLQESMESYDGANVSWQFLSALSGREISVWIFTIHFYDVVSIIKISFWVLVGELPTEEFWESLHLNLMNGAKVKPLSATWNYKRIPLVNFFYLLDFRNLLEMQKLLLISHLSQTSHWINQGLLLHNLVSLPISYRSLFDLLVDFVSNLILIGLRVDLSFDIDRRVPNRLIASL